LLPSSPEQPARPIVAASASIAIKGTRDRVKPWAPADFMIDSLEKPSDLRTKFAVPLGYRNFWRDPTEAGKFHAPR
jgi:hypothetical protein